MSHNMTKERAIQLFREGNVEAWNEWRQTKTPPDRADHLDPRAPNLRGVDCSELTLSGINLEACDLNAAKFAGARLAGAILDRARCHGVDFRRSDLSYTSAQRLSLVEADLTEARVNLASWTNAKLTGVICERTTFTGSDLSHCNLSDLTLTNASLEKAVMYRVQVDRITCRGVNFTGASFSECKFMRHTALESCVFVNCRGLFGRQRGEIENPSAADIDTLHFASPRDFADWGRIRLAGAIPFFGVSNVALVAIITYANAAQWWNAQLMRIHTALNGHPAIDSWLSHVGPLPAPAHFGRLLLAFALLFVGSLLYKVFCPEVVSEYSQTQWERELEKSAIEYRSAMYSHLVFRYICTLCYILGGGYAAFYLLIQVFKTASFLLGF